MASKGLEWRAAIERVAESANVDRWDSIVRNLNRARWKPIPPDVQVARLAAPPGLAILYDLIRKRFEEIERMVMLMVPNDDDILPLIPELDDLREVVNSRIVVVTGAPPVQLQEIARLARFHGDFKAERMKHLEIEHLKNLLSELDRLRRAIRHRESISRRRERVQ